MFETLLAKVDGAVGQLTLNQPAKLNPLSTTVLTELAAAARWFESQPEVKVVIVGGAGRAFSAGADLSTFEGPQEGSPREAADRGREMAEALENMRPLSIAAIQGWCVGGGLVLAAACDLRVAAENSGKLVSLVRKEARNLADREGLKYIIVDGPPGIGCPVISSITGSTLVVIVTEPTVSGFHDCERVAALARHFAVDGVYVDEQARRFVGCQSIQKEYQTLFTRTPICGCNL